MKTALATFARVPELGKVKTRLAKTTGDVYALEAYKALLGYTFNLIADVAADVHVFVTPQPLENCPFEQHLQPEGDLGQRMAYCANKLFLAGYESVIFIGTDCAELHISHIENAITALKTSRIVIGPATDGGYYLLGMNGMTAEIFEDMPWSTAQLYEQTVDKIRQLNRTFATIEPLSDIDEWPDLEPYLDKLGLSRCAILDVSKKSCL